MIYFGRYFIYIIIISLFPAQWSGQPAFPALALIRYSIVDFWIMYKNLQIHAMRATFHIKFFQSGSMIKNTRALLGYFDLRKCQRPDHWVSLVSHRLSPTANPAGIGQAQESVPQTPQIRNLQCQIQQDASGGCY